MSEAAPQASAGQGAQIARCMIVDDDPGICKAISFSLRRMGVETTEVATLPELDKALDAPQPELLFLDLSLGNGEGTDALALLKRRNFKGWVQIMSGRSQQRLDEVVDAGKRNGLKMLTPAAKPFRMGLVKELVASLGSAA